MTTSSVIKLQSPFERLKIASPSPEIALARSIILQAIIDASSTSESLLAKKIKKEAEEWLFKDSIAFTEICTDANFEVQYVRKIALEMIEYNKNKHSNLEH